MLLNCGQFGYSETLSNMKAMKKYSRMTGHLTLVKQQDGERGWRESGVGYKTRGKLGERIECDINCGIGHYWRPNTSTH